METTFLPQAFTGGRQVGLTTPLIFVLRALHKGLKSFGALVID